MFHHPPAHLWFIRVGLCLDNAMFDDTSVNRRRLAMATRTIFLAVCGIVLLQAVAAAQPRLPIFRGGVVSRPGYFGPGPNLGRTPGPGVGWSYYGLPDGPTTAFTGVGVGFWPGFGIPAANGSFWTNGLSLYGPPIPTYAPVPGVFGGSDAHRHYMNPPLLGVGTHAFGYLSPSPRLRTPSVSVYSQAARGTATVQALPAPSATNLCRLEVHVPHTEAEVWINKSKTTTTGLERSFESPELAEGKTYEYEVIARWHDGTEKRAVAKTVSVTAGKTVLVSFTEPNE
jgi:uncharacterized protein (TIGR03000 family)